MAKQKTQQVIKYCSLKSTTHKNLKSYCKYMFIDSYLYYYILQPFKRLINTINQPKVITAPLFDCVFHLKIYGKKTPNPFKIKGDPIILRNMISYISSGKMVNFHCYDIRYAFKALELYMRLVLNGIVSLDVTKYLKYYFKSNTKKDLTYFPFLFFGMERDLVLEILEMFNCLLSKSEINNFTENEAAEKLTRMLFPNIVQKKSPDYVKFVALSKEILKLDFEHVPVYMLDDIE